MLFLRQSAGQMADRRPLRFWQPFNDWWRQELAHLGRRPNATEIVAWYNKNAVRLWGSEAPTIQDTRIHAKCLRSLGSVKDYFRQYRKKKRKGERDASTEPDASYEEPDLPTRFCHRRYSTLSRSDTEQDQQLPDTLRDTPHQINKELNLALDHPQFRLPDVYTLQSMPVECQQPYSMQNVSPMPLPTAPFWDHNMLNLGTPGQQMHTAVTAPVPQPANMLQGEPMMQQHLWQQPLSMPQDRQMVSHQPPIHMQLGKQVEHQLPYLSPPTHMLKVEHVQHQPLPQLKLGIDHKQRDVQQQDPTQQQLFTDFVKLQAQHKAAQQQQQVLAALARQYALAREAQMQQGVMKVNQLADQAFGAPDVAAFNSMRNNNISMPGSISSWDSQDNSMLQHHASSHQSYDGQPIAKLLYQAPSYPGSDMRVPSYAGLCPSMCNPLDLSHPMGSQQQSNTKKRPARERSTDMQSSENCNHVCFADDDSWDSIRKTVFETQTQSTSPAQTYPWSMQQPDSQTGSGSQDGQSQMQLGCQAQQQQSGLPPGAYPDCALTNLVDQIRQFPGAPTIPDVQDPNQDKPDKALVKLYQQLNKFNQRVKQLDTCMYCGHQPYARQAVISCLLL